jgi:hypothetical protein
MNDTITAILASIGAASGLGSVFWHWRNWENDRLDVRVEAAVTELHPAPSLDNYVALLMAAQAPRFALSVHLVNHGRRDVQIVALGLRCADRQQENAELVNELPCLLRGGERRMFKLPLAMFRSDLVALFAVDGRGREWPLHQVDLLKVQRSVREANKTLAAEKDSRSAALAAMVARTERSGTRGT